MTKYMRSYISCMHYIAIAIPCIFVYTHMHTLNTLYDFNVYDETIYRISIYLSSRLDTPVNIQAKQLRSYNLLYIATHDFLALIPYTNLNMATINIISIIIYAIIRTYI